MDNVTRALALLRKHAELEHQLMNSHGASAAAEQDLDITRRCLAAHPQAVNAVLQTARALHRTPDTVTATDVAHWTSST